MSKLITANRYSEKQEYTRAFSEYYSLIQENSIDARSLAFNMLLTIKKISRPESIDKKSRLLILENLGTERSPKNLIKSDFDACIPAEHIKYERKDRNTVDLMRINNVTLKSTSLHIIVDYLEFLSEHQLFELFGNWIYSDMVLVNPTDSMLAFAILCRILLPRTMYIEILLSSNAASEQNDHVAPKFSARLNEIESTLKSLDIKYSTDLASKNFNIKLTEEFYLGEATNSLYCIDTKIFADRLANYKSKVREEIAIFQSSSSKMWLFYMRSYLLESLIKFFRKSSPVSIYDLRDLYYKIKRTYVVIPTNERYEFALRIAYCDGFKVYIRGVVRDRNFPNLPVRLTFLNESRVVGTVIARTFSTDPGQEGFFEFSLTLLLDSDEGYCKLEAIEFTSRVCIAHLLVGSNATHRNSFLSQIASTEIKYTLPHDHIIGSVDRISLKSVSGWAFNGSNLDRIVQIVLLVNEMPFAVQNCEIYREDVKTKFGGSGFFGFLFDLPASLNVQGEVTLSVKPVVGMNRLRKTSETIIPQDLDTCLHTDYKHYIYQSRRSGNHVHSVSIVVLNRNGKSLLEAMFRTFIEFENSLDIEWIIVDHGSVDGSDLLIDCFVDQGLNIKFLNRDGNYSFSDSNNFGVDHATGDIIIFANNDLEFVGPIISDFVSCLGDEQVGCVGINLLDKLYESSTDYKILQHQGVFINPSLVNGFIAPYEGRFFNSEVVSDKPHSTIVPAVTGAFFAFRKNDFLAVGGFTSDYFYGLEDVDLCLKIRARLKKAVICRNNLGLVHHRGYSRKHFNSYRHSRRKNYLHFNAIWSPFFRSSVKSSPLSRGYFWFGRVPTIGFIVTDSGDNTSAGEYYTAMELAHAVSNKVSVNVRFLTENDWYDLSNIDLLVVMVNRFNLHKVRNVSPFLVTVNWMRQWFDRWASDDTLYSYDYLFCSSPRAVDFIADRTGLRSKLLPIATNYDFFNSGQFNTSFDSDFVFSGGKFGIAREIEYCLDPHAIAGKGLVCGRGWEGTPFECLSIGNVNYSDMPNVYASTKIVLDDANIATKPWGSCNSRVFDAIAAGRLVLSNGAIGSEDLFEGLIPVYSDKSSLTDELNFWLSNKALRDDRVVKLQELVRNLHTYNNRAETFLSVVESKDAPLRISIKIAAKFSEREHWGDFHFANSLARALRKLGYTVRVDCRESWNLPLGDSDDVTICLRGLIHFVPKPHQINLLWVISHPDAVTLSEMNSYHHVFVASDAFANSMERFLSVPVSFMAQCTDPDRFRFKEEDQTNESDVIGFVGNSRGIFRDAVKYAIQAKANLHVYGTGWEGIIDKSYIKGDVLPNELLGRFYSRCKLVLCDHWDDMRRLEFVSNRVFDVAGAGGVLLTDQVNGIPDELTSVVLTFSDFEDFLEKVKIKQHVDVSSRRQVSSFVHKFHSFDSRAVQIDRVLRSTISSKLVID